MNAVIAGLWRFHSEVNYGDDQISEKIQSGDMEEMMQAVVISEIIEERARLRARAVARAGF